MGDRARRFSNRFVASAVAALVPVLHAAIAAADESIQLRYSAPPECIDAATFGAGLRSLPRSSRGGPPREATVVVAIERRGDRFVGGASVRHADGTLTERTVESQRCDEVSEALELVVALAAGLEYSTAPRATSPRPSAPPTLPLAPAPSSPSAARWRLRGSLRGALLIGAAPSPEVAANVGIGVAHDGPGLFSPVVEISGTWATSGNIVASEGTATLTQWSGALAVCPLRFDLGARFSSRPCVELDAGVLSGSASGPKVVAGSAQTEPWVAAAFLPQVEWSFAEHIAIELEAGPAVEFYRDRFFFNPQQTDVYRVAGGVFLARLGVVAKWP
jgi:hypothetical protein